MFSPAVLGGPGLDSPGSSSHVIRGCLVCLLPQTHFGFTDSWLVQVIRRADTLRVFRICKLFTVADQFLHATLDYTCSPSVVNDLCRIPVNFYISFYTSLKCPQKSKFSYITLEYTEKLHLHIW